MRKYFYCWIIYRKCETYPTWTIQDVTPIEESMYKKEKQIKDFINRHMNMPNARFIGLKLSFKKIRLLLPIKKG